MSRDYTAEVDLFLKGHRISTIAYHQCNAGMGGVTRNEIEEFAAFRVGDTGMAVEVGGSTEPKQDQEVDLMRKAHLVSLHYKQRYNALYLQYQ